MLIDPIAIVFSPARHYSNVPANQASVIEEFNIALPAVGWTRTASIKATYSLTYPFGFPAVSGVVVTPKRVVGCPSTPFLAIGSVNFAYYDPFQEVPIAGAACAFFALDPDPAVGIQNLADKITSSTAFDATVTAPGGGGFILSLVAKVAGALANFIRVLPDGRWGFSGGVTSGGGYTFQSAPEASVYSVTIIGTSYLFGDIRFSFLFASSPAATVVYTLHQTGQNTGPAIGRYFIAANGYGFLITDGTLDVQFTGAGRNTSLFVMAPYIPLSTDVQVPESEVFDTAAYAVFILGPHTFRQATFWFGAGGSIATCLDVQPAVYSNTGGWPRLLALRNPGTPLTTPSGVPLIFGAYVEFGSGPSSSANVVGKLWDCCTVHDQILGGGMIQGQHWVTVGSQSGASAYTATSLLMCVPAPVELQSGTCNLFGAGVTRLTGPNFTAALVGGGMTIAGRPYVVASVTDADHLTLTEAITILAGVGYTVP